MPDVSWASKSLNSFPPLSLFFFFSQASKTNVHRGGCGGAPSSTSITVSRKARAHERAAATTSPLSPFFVRLNTQLWRSGTRHSLTMNVCSSPQRWIASSLGSGFLPFSALASFRLSALNCLAANLACCFSSSSGGAASFAMVCLQEAALVNRGSSSDGTDVCACKRLPWSPEAPQAMVPTCAPARGCLYDQRRRRSQCSCLGKPRYAGNTAAQRQAGLV